MQASKVPAFLALFHLLIFIIFCGWQGGSSFAMAAAGRPSPQISEGLGAFRRRDDFYKMAPKELGL